jgi:transcriptional regulator with XRE-family HTH domain
LPSSPREQLGRKLRDLRLRAGLSGDALAAQTGLSQSKVSRVERGLSLPSVEELRAWATATEASGSELRDLLGFVEQVATSATSWRVLHQLGLAEKQQEIAELEQQAIEIRTFQPSMIPGLLQTADYARRMLTESFPGITMQDIQARMERQAILYDESKRFAFVITEAALRWKPGDTDMRPQLDRLTSMASLPNVTILVLPIGVGSLPILHPFVIWHLEDEVTVSVETYSAELWVTELREVDRYREVWQRLSETAQPWRPGLWPTPTP